MTLLPISTPLPPASTRRVMLLRKRPVEQGVVALLRRRAMVAGARGFRAVRKGRGCPEAEQAGGDDVVADGGKEGAQIARALAERCDGAARAGGVELDLDPR